MAENKKRHHFVPQFYLKNFAKDGERISVLRKSTGGIFGGHVRDYGQEHRFYEPPDPDNQYSQEDKQALEDYFAALESQSGATISKILKSLDTPSFIHTSGVPNYRLSIEEKHTLSSHLVFQSIRTREYRETIRQMSYMFSRAAARMVAAETGELGKRYGHTVDIQIAEDYFKLQHLQQLLDDDFLNTLVNVCMDKIWLIGINRTGLPLYTSDHPVCKIHHLRGAPFRGQGWTGPGVEIALPLSPNVLLALWPRDLYSFTMKELTSRSIIPNCVQELKSEHVQYYNSFQVFQSYDFLYSPSANFDQAITMINEQPRFKNPYRQRIEFQNGDGKEVLPDDWDLRKYGLFTKNDGK